jgi:hypothetical protein
MSSYTNSMANRAEGSHERIAAGAKRACRENAPEWVISLLSDEAIRLEHLACDVRRMHEEDESSRPRTVWDPPETCPHRERCGAKGDAT